MDRRAFLTSLVGGVAATAAVRSFPFRVYSFPEEIVIPKPKCVRYFAGRPDNNSEIFVAIYRTPVNGGPFYLVETLSPEEARAKYRTSATWSPSLDVLA